MKYRAFTLVEVVITLVAVGVIAVLLIPSLYVSFQRHIYYTSFVKTYRELNDAVKLATMKYGTLDRWRNIDSNTAASRFAEFLNVEESCIKDNEDCFENYDEYKNLDGSSNFQDIIGNAWLASNKYTLKNNIEVYFSCSGHYNSGGLNCEETRCVVEFDTNGSKKPNTMGRDFFVTEVFPYSGELSPYGAFNLIEGNNGKCHAIPSAFMSGHLDDTAFCNNFPLFCAYKLIHDGKMDY